LSLALALVRLALALEQALALEREPVLTPGYLALFAQAEQLAEALALEQALAAVPREQAVSEAEQRAPEGELVLPVVQEAVLPKQAVSEVVSLVREPVQARPS
jgi:hypothetical protein